MPCGHHSLSIQGAFWNAKTIEEYTSLNTARRVSSASEHVPAVSRLSGCLRAHPPQLGMHLFDVDPSAVLRNSTDLLTCVKTAPKRGHTGSMVGVLDHAWGRLHDEVSDRAARQQPPPKELRAGRLVCAGATWVV